MNLEFDLAKGLILSVLLGLAIGFQRELSYYYENSKVKFTGARSFALISLLGFFAGHFSATLPNLSITITIIFGLWLISAYVVRAIKNEKNGTTTEFAAICAFLAGFAANQKSYVFAVFAVVLVLIILEVKSFVLKIRDEIKLKDMQSAILFLLITFVVLPVIPNCPIDPTGIFNPYSIWLMVVIISGLSFAGYIAIRVVGASRGLLAVGFLGGLVSSTATTVSLSKKANPTNVKNLALAIALACNTMFARIVILLAAINITLASKMAILFLPSAFCGYIYIYLSYQKLEQQSLDNIVSYDNPLEFISALKLGILFGVIFGVTKLLQEFTGSYGVYLFSFISGLTDVDAISLSLSQLVSDNKMLQFTAITGILIAAVANTLAKLAISFWTGGILLAKELALVMLIPIVVSCAIFAIWFM